MLSSSIKPSITIGAAHTKSAYIISGLGKYTFLKIGSGHYKEGIWVIKPFLNGTSWSDGMYLECSKVPSDPFVQDMKHKV